jgi:hypothetical protein
MSPGPRNNDGSSQQAARLGKSIINRGFLVQSMPEVRSRGQVSVEYILILSFVLAIIIHGVIFFYQYSQTSVSNVASVQYERFGQEMLMTALSSAAQGDGSWLTLDGNIPSGLQDINVTGSDDDELVFTFRTSTGLTQAIYFSEVRLCANTSIISECPLQGSVFSAGPHSGRVSFRFIAGINSTTGQNYVAIKEQYG